MSYYLFDNPRVGIVLALIVASVLFLAWVLGNKRLALGWILAGPLLLAVVLALDYAVQTDREAVEDKTRWVLEAAEQEDADTIIALLGPDFELDNGMDRDQAAAVIEHHLARPLISTNRLRELKVEQVDDLRGQVLFSVTTVIDPDSRWAVFPIVKSSWRFIFTRPDSESEYLLQKMELPTVGDGRIADINIWKKNLAPDHF